MRQHLCISEKQNCDPKPAANLSTMCTLLGHPGKSGSHKTLGPRQSVTYNGNGTCSAQSELRADHWQSDSSLDNSEFDSTHSATTITPHEAHRRTNSESLAPPSAKQSRPSRASGSCHPIAHWPSRLRWGSGSAGAERHGRVLGYACKL